jgi:hypothetical protein
MNAPPISEATFLVEVACSEMVDPEMLDPETGVVAAASGDAELICAIDNEADSPTRASSATNPVENDLISANVSLEPDSNRNLRAES